MVKGSSGLTDLRVGVSRMTEAGSVPISKQYADQDEIDRLVREALAESFGLSDVSTPFAGFITSGQVVLLKPNLVSHLNYSSAGLECVITHPRFVLAVLKEVLAAKPSKVVIADAPIQLCSWSAVMPPSLRTEIESLAAVAGVETEVLDLRRTVASTMDLASGVENDRRSAEKYVLFDLKEDSLLEPISRPTGRFRVTNYDPEKLAESHQPGKHLYLLCREAFEADVIISLAKLKTHAKAGITGALKNLVGLNGNKDYLPHHRVGSPAEGGDCYPRSSVRRRLAEYFLDSANRRIGRRSYRYWRHLAMRNWSQIAQVEEGGMEGGWHGNDTVWRMVLDLNRILLYGTSDGTTSNQPQRRIFTLTDAIVCGEGQGPLAPEPVVVGAVTFSDSSAACDVVNASLLGLDWKRIPLIREAFSQFRWPLVPPENEVVAICRGEFLNPDQVAEMGVSARPPAGWVGHIERVRTA